MAGDDHLTVLGEGRFLRLVRRGRWEYVERSRPASSAFIAAVTDAGNLILTREYRVPVGAVVIGFPAGLIGDVTGLEGESLEEAVRRELEEEAGFEAEKVVLLTRGPTSAGQTSEVIAIVLATGLKRVGPGGGLENEQISVEEVPLRSVHEWLDARGKEGRLIDPKIYTALYFLQHQSSHQEKEC